jgi:hypothetical protein
MKKILASAIVLCFSAVTMAQVILSPDLNMEGTFQKRSDVIARGSKTLKSCKAQGGHLYNGRCVVGPSEDFVSIIHIGSEYLVRIMTKPAGKAACNFEGIATELNKVQLISQQGNCELQIHFEDQNTVDVRTNGLCNETSACGYDVSLKLDSLKRVSTKKK